MSSIWRLRGMSALVGMTFAGFAGYAVLLPVAPLWVVHGGADAAGAGFVNGALLLLTVLTQLFVPPALGRLGWGPVLVTGMLLLGVPGVLLALSDALVPVLLLSALRGVGFGVLTVSGSAAVAALVDPGRRGEAIGVYGLAVALPNLVLLPAGPWVAEHVGYGPVFLVSALPVAAIPFALRLAEVIHTPAPDLLHLQGVPEAGVPSGVAPTGVADGEAEPERTAYLRLLRPTVLLLSVTLAGGAIITFAPQMVSNPVLTTAGLLVMGLVATWSRWRVGVLADRHGAEQFIWPLVVVTAAGMSLTAWSVADTSQTAPAVFLIAMALVGLSYGALQNLTLVVAFGVVSPHHRNLASAVWNVGFDAGTALGSVAVGSIAVATSFPAALLAVATASLAALPIAIRRPVSSRPVAGRLPRGGSGPSG